MSENFKAYKSKLRRKGTLRKHGAGMDPSCPKCGSPMYWRDSAGLTGMHPEGAWECSNQRCWHMLTPGELAPDTVPATMDPQWQPEGWDAEPYSPGGHRCPMCKNHRLIEEGKSLLCPECHWAGEKFIPPEGFEYPEGSE